MCSNRPPFPFAVDLPADACIVGVKVVDANLCDCRTATIRYDVGSVVVDPRLAPPVDLPPIARNRGLHFALFPSHGVASVNVEIDATSRYVVVAAPCDAKVAWSLDPHNGHLLLAADKLAVVRELTVDEWAALATVTDGTTCGVVMGGLACQWVIRDGMPQLQTYTLTRPDGWSLQGWLENGSVHRVDGPATVIRSPRDDAVVAEIWAQHGACHRHGDDPAVTLGIDGQPYPLEWAAAFPFTGGPGSAHKDIVLTTGDRTVLEYYKNGLLTRADDLPARVTREPLRRREIWASGGCVHRIRGDADILTTDAAVVGRRFVYGDELVGTASTPSSRVNRRRKWKEDSDDDEEIPLPKRVRRGCELSDDDAAVDDSDDDE
jgi:hypothetical protein